MKAALSAISRSLSLSLGAVVRPVIMLFFLLWGLLACRPFFRVGLIDCGDGEGCFWNFSDVGFVFFRVTINRSKYNFLPDTCSSLIRHIVSQFLSIKISVHNTSHRALFMQVILTKHNQ